MKYLLILIILLAGAGCYYEYTLYTALQVVEASDQQKIKDLNDKIDTLAADSKKQTTDKATMDKNLADEKAKTANLTTELSSAQDAASTAQKRADEATKTLQDKLDKEKELAAAKAAKLTNDLGTIQTQDGKTYANCKMLSLDADGVTVACEPTIIKLYYSILPPALQKKFAYDPKTASKLSDARVKFLIEQIQTADAISN
jgi:septal ring factor EnvC (AmiA/AmiB activator)